MYQLVQIPEKVQLSEGTFSKLFEIQLINPFALLCHIKWYSSITKITNACGTATSTAEQSLQNWIWREALCMTLLLMQTGVEPPATEVGGPRMTSVPCCTHHCTQCAAALSRAVTGKGPAEVLTQFPHHHHQQPKKKQGHWFPSPLYVVVAIPRCTPTETTRCRTKGHSISRGAVFPKHHTIPSHKVIVTSTQQSTRRVLETSMAWCI